PVGHPLPLVPLVEIEAQSDHARSLLALGDEVAAVRVVEIKPAHDAEARGIFPHRFDRQLVRIRVPQHRVDQRAVDTGFIHRGDRLLCRVRLLAVLRRWRALVPEMDLRVDDQHLAYPFDPKIFSRPRIRRSLKSVDSAQSSFKGPLTALRSRSGRESRGVEPGRTSRPAICLHLPDSCLWQTTSHQRVEVAAPVRTYWPATSRVERRRIIMMAAASNSIPIQRQSAAVATRRIP